MFVVAVATIDFAPLRVYRYLLVSDVLLLAALALEWRRQWPATLVYPARMTALFCVYLASAACAFTRPLDPAIGFSTFAHQAFAMLLYVPAVATLLVARPDLLRLVIPTVLVSMTVQGLALASAVAGGLNWTSGSRVAGALGSSQLWPYVAAVGAITLVTMSGSALGRLAVVGSAVAVGAAELFMRSRMLWIASVLVVTTVALLQSRRKAAAGAGAAALIGALAVIYALGGFPPAVEVRIDDALHPAKARDLVERVRVVSALGRSFLESPFVGVGLGQSPQFVDQLPVQPAVVNIHNIVMHGAVEGGVFAGLAVLLQPVGILLLWKSGRRNRESKALADWSVATLLSVFVAAQLTPTLYEHTYYFLIGLLAAIACRHTPDRISVADITPAFT